MNTVTLSLEDYNELKERAMGEGFAKATSTGYNYRKVCRDLDDDTYYSGWMDCLDFITKEINCK